MVHSSLFVLSYRDNGDQQGLQVDDMVGLLGWAHLFKFVLALLPRSGLRDNLNL